MAFSDCADSFAIGHYELLDMANGANKDFLIGGF